MELLEQIERYLGRSHMPRSRFGRLVLGDPRFVDDLKNGRCPRRKTIDRVLAYLRGAASHQRVRPTSQPDPMHLRQSRPN